MRKIEKLSGVILPRTMPFTEKDGVDHKLHRGQYEVPPITSQLTSRTMEL